MDKKEEIIAIVFGDKKLFFKGSLISIRPALKQNTPALDEIPDGKVKEYYADLCMEKMYKNGRLLSSLTFSGRTEKSIRQELLDATDNDNRNVIPITEGKTFLRNIHQRIFFINGKQTALQELTITGKVISSQGETFSGDAKEFYLNGAIKQEIYFENGLPEGLVKTYDKEGRLISFEEYKNGVREGRAQRFNFINNIKSEEELSFKDGFIHGTRKVLSPTGKLLLSEDYKTGKRHGEVKMFNNNSILEVQASYKEGKKEGKRIFYYEDGQIMHVENFSNGLMQGERKTFSKNGTLLVSENYHNNLLHGERTLYHQDGAEKAKEIYENGKLVKRENK